MNQLKVIGEEQIGKIKFTGIEGGFGKDKKAMLVKDIAKIHRKDIRYINKLINNNIARFRNGIDLIDFLSSSEELRDFAKENNLIGSNRTQHIYLLSERGYSKLLKILEDDKAWEIYDQLVDNYFNMRTAIKDNSLTENQQERLKIMKDNASTRKASLLYRIAMHTGSDSSREQLLASAAKELTGEMTIPIMKEKLYTATQVGEKLDLTANAVGRISNKIRLKAELPEQNEYGRWANSKSKYSPKEVPQWLYTEKGLNRIKEYGYLY